MPAGASLSAGDLNRNEIDFPPAPGEVAGRSHFSYVSQHLSQGHEVRHWLEGEAQLLAERTLNRVHGFHDRT
jgi:hypothetical protein